MIFELAPAKLNLSLAVTGRRADGFHNLVSLVVPVKLADRLEFTPGNSWSLRCDDPTLPIDQNNLVLKAAGIYQKHRPNTVRGEFNLLKKIPSGAGLGGGSSDAVAALRLLDRAQASPLGEKILLEMAAEVGSDCPYFIKSSGAVMRGRGEIIEPLPDAVLKALQGRSVIIVKPPFGVSTIEAYSLIAQSKSYDDLVVANHQLQLWMNDPQSDPSYLGNRLQPMVFNKYLALPVALSEVKQATGVDFMMTGSGSACFAFCSPELDPSPIDTILERCWGPGVWRCFTEIC